MTKRDLTTYTYVAALGIAFVVVSTAIWMLGTKPSLVKAKLRIGATLIALNTMMAGCDGWTSNCYAGAGPEMDTASEAEGNDYMTIEIPQEGPFFDVTSGQAQLSGEVLNRTQQDYSFVVKDRAGDIQQVETIEPLDGAFDDENEQFQLTLDPSLAPGDYTLELFAVSAEEAETGATEPRSVYPITVLDPSDTDIIMCYAPPIEL